jgi:hypothetical protein
MKKQIEIFFWKKVNLKRKRIKFDTKRKKTNHKGW